MTTPPPEEPGIGAPSGDALPHLPPPAAPSSSGSLNDGPPPIEHASGNRRFGWRTAVVVVFGALAAGAAAGALGIAPWGGATPVASPSPSASPSPTVTIPTTRLTIPEGFTAEQIYARGEEVLGIPVADFEAAAAQPDLIGLPPEANGLVEGWLGPYTYHITETATAADVLSEMVAATLMHLELLEVAPEDWLDVLTRASLIEREVIHAEDRPKVARVIQNRLDAGMALQFDSTVRYIAGGDSVFTTDADRAIDSPYNTYRYAGLPPGPICSPGIPSIEAVLTPADGTWLFFVTVNLDTGETAFATTLEEHEHNVQILRDWMAANP